MKRIPIPISTKPYEGEGKKGCDDYCLLCKRPVVSAKCQYVHISVMGEIIHPGEGGALDSQGCFPVGPECIKKVPREYRLGRS